MLIGEILTHAHSKHKLGSEKKPVALKLVGGRKHGKIGNWIKGNEAGHDGGRWIHIWKSK